MVGVVDTLKSSECDALCERGTHGTVALFIIAKRGLVNSHLKSSYNEGCSNKTPPNKEKGQPLHSMKIRQNRGKMSSINCLFLEI